MAAGAVDTVDFSPIPLYDGLPTSAFSIDVIADGDCFYHALLLSFQVLYPSTNFADKNVKDIDIDYFKVYLMGLASDDERRTGASKVLESLSIKKCWAGEEDIVWIVNNIGINLHIYDISTDPVNVKQYTKLGNTKTIRLVYTGNHYMSFFFNDSTPRVIEMDIAEERILSRSDTMKKRIDRRKKTEQDKPPDIFSIINSLASKFKVDISGDPRQTLRNLKEGNYIDDEQFKTFGEQLNVIGLRKYYYKKYLKYKNKYLALKAKTNL